MAASPIELRRGPATLSLAGAARLRLDAGLLAAEGAQMRRFLVATGNRPDGGELAVVGPDDLGWFAVISRRPGRAGRREEWIEDTLEAGGRQVRIRTVVVPVGDVLFTFEVVSERRDAARAQWESDRLLARLETPASHAPPLWPLALAVAPAAGLLWIVRRRQRGL